MRSSVVDLDSQPVRNLARNPRAATVPTGYSFNSNLPGTTSRVATGGPGNTSFVRRTLTAASTPALNADLFSLAATAWVAGTGATLPGTGPCPPGTVVRSSLWVRASRATNLRLQHQSLKGNGGATGNLYGTVTPVAANVWTELTIGPTVAQSDWQAIRLDLDAGDATTAWQVGDTLDVTQISVLALPVSTTTPMAYADGDTPGWRWTGTAHDSESVGYPYTLESIAGRPALHLMTPSTAMLPLSALQGRTLYAAHRVIDLASTSFQAARYGANSSTSRMHVGTHIASAPDMRARFDTENGGVNEMITQAGYRTVGVHVHGLRASEGVTEGAYIVDGSSIATRALTPGNGFVDSEVALRTGPSDTGLAALVYGEPHNETTMRRVMAWLARQYGSPVPSGY